VGKCFEGNFFWGSGNNMCFFKFLPALHSYGYRSGGPGSIPGTTRKKKVGLEWGPLSFVSITEELLDRKVAAPV
jgi:hypothetical protein